MSVPGFSQLLVLLEVLGVPWLRDVSLHSLLQAFHGLFPVGLCLFSSFDKDSSLWIGNHCTPVWYSLDLIICEALVSK